MVRPEVAMRVFRIEMQEGFESTRVKLHEGKREARTREELPDPEPKSTILRLRPRTTESRTTLRDYNDK